VIARQIPRLYIPEPDDQVEREPVEPKVPRHLVQRLLRQTMIVDRIREALWYYHPPTAGRGRKKRRTRRHERR